MQVWGDKPYYSLNYYLKQEFGQKVYKLSLNGGMTCPNRDGTLGTSGCIFCSLGGSGDFAASPELSVTNQIEEAKKLVKGKINGKDITEKYIAYFQAYTNTYGEISHLRNIFTEAISHPDIAALSIATRPDCLADDVIALLADLNKIKPVWIELGLQTCHEKTSLLIRRGYSLSCFEEAVKNLHQINVTMVVHIILGLPGESFSDMLETISYITSFHKKGMPIQGIKLQLLHVLKNTDLAKYSFHVLSLEEYMDILISCIEMLPKDMVIHRLTGDGPKSLLIAPLWSSNKKLVLNRIHKEFKIRKTWQGKCWDVI
ncbi:TIGR01212 family radical SAM protein [Anaerocolumna aminovalerica]|uniref:TIGR01212 family radical SAM protein n=1 Tax=Anaerocolumna aminovalerica TaxID=1527 RepID=UPI000BE3CDA4